MLPDDDFFSKIAVRYEKHSLAPGDKVGCLRIESILGRQGNVSTVFRAKAVDDAPEKGIQKNFTYIVKGIPAQESSHQTTNTRNLRSFFNEMRILPHIRNPEKNNIVELLDCNGDPSKGKLFMAFREIAYQAVREKYPNKQVDPEIVLGIAKGLNRGLSHIHGLGIAHGDVKPENFMIDFGGVAKLVDFGSSFFYGRKSQGGKSFPADPPEYKEAFTPLYTSPEVAKFKLYEIGGNPKTDKADAWALGLTIAELLTGERPYYWLQDFSLQSILETVSRGIPPVRTADLEALEKQASRGVLKNAYRFFINLVARFIEFSPEKRLSCANAFGEILQFTDIVGESRTAEPTDKIRGKVEMARKLADMDSDSKEAELQKKRRQRDSSKLEIEAFEMRQAYLKSLGKPKTTIQKGWSPGYEKAEPKPEPAPGKALKHKSFEEFIKDKESPKDDRKGEVSFEEYRQKKEAESVSKMKELFDSVETDTKHSMPGEDRTKELPVMRRRPTPADADDTLPGPESGQGEPGFPSPASMGFETVDEGPANGRGLRRDNRGPGGPAPDETTWNLPSPAPEPVSGADSEPGAGEPAADDTLPGFPKPDARKEVRREPGGNVRQDGRGRTGSGAFSGTETVDDPLDGGLHLKPEDIRPPVKGWKSPGKENRKKPGKPEKE